MEALKCVGILAIFAVVALTAVCVWGEEIADRTGRDER
jgi:hypothetical protein